MTMWTKSDAIELARLVEAVAPRFDCHVALTGGCLYKDGDRKDCDLLFYRVRQADEIDVGGLLETLVVGLDFKLLRGGAGCWNVKAEYRGKKVDLFFPDAEGDYHDDEDAKPDDDRPFDFDHSDSDAPL